MAEEFLNRLDQIEEKIEGLGETLKRMITILSSATDIKSDIRQSKDDILDAIAASQDMSVSCDGVSRDEVQSIIKNELEVYSTNLEEKLDALNEDLQSTFKEHAASVSQQVSTQPSTVQSESQADVAAQSPSSLPGDRSVKVANELQEILDSLKMGCVAGDVLETMNESKENITKIVPSDPIMVKIDKWAAIVKSYNLRHELQARDILKIKKELREEIPKYGLS